MSKITTNTRLKQIPQNVDALFYQDLKKELLPPRKPKFIEQILETYHQPRKSDGGESQKTPLWLQRFQRKCPIVVKLQVPDITVKIGDEYANIHSVQFSPDGEKVVCGSGMGDIQVRNAFTGALEGTIREAKGLPVTRIRFRKTDPDKFFAVGICGTIFDCCLERYTCEVFAKEKNNEINCCDTNKAGNCLATAGKDATVRLYDVNTAKLFQKNRRADVGQAHSIEFHRQRVLALRFHPVDENVYLTGGWDECVKVWDVRLDEGCVMNIKGPYICGDALDIRDNMVLTGSYTIKDNVQLWDLRTGTLLDTIVATNRPQYIDSAFPYCTKFFENIYGDDYVFSAGTGTARLEILNFRTKRVTSYYIVHNAVRSIDSHRGRLVFGGAENVLRIAESRGLPPEDALPVKDSLYQLY